MKLLLKLKIMYWAMYKLDVYFYKNEFGNTELQWVKFNSFVVEIRLSVKV